MTVILADSDTMATTLTQSITGETHIAQSHEELTELVVDHPEMTAVVVHREDGVAAERGRLQRLKSTFPLLGVLLIAPTDAEATVGEHSSTDAPSSSVAFIDRRTEGWKEQLHAWIDSVREQNRRRHQRFDWPLQGHVRVPGTVDDTFEVRSMSCSGAFLVAPEPILSPGAQGTIEIEFADFQVAADFRVVDRRDADEHSRGGFGLEFLGVTEHTKTIIDNLVEAELRHTLLNSDAQPNPPSLS
jgi:hypothetical protein